MSKIIKVANSKKFQRTNMKAMVISSDFICWDSANNRASATRMITRVDEPTNIPPTKSSQSAFLQTNQEAWLFTVNPDNDSVGAIKLENLPRKTNSSGQYHYPVVLTLVTCQQINKGASGSLGTTLMRYTLFLTPPRTTHHYRRYR